MASGAGSASREGAEGLVIAAAMAVVAAVNAGAQRLPHPQPRVGGAL